MIEEEDESPRLWWTNGNEFTLAWGEPRERFHKGVPEHAWTINLRLWPFRLIVFKHLKRIIWLGDGEWKKDLLV